jgi:L-aspartate oxidase
VRLVVPGAWEELRATMSTGAGLVRNGAGLREALDRVRAIAARSSGRLRAAATAAVLICRSALERAESRGVHFRSDAPERDPRWDGRHVTLRLE